MNRTIVWATLLVFTILNLIAAGLTELYNDEAYYWAYSRFLDWGYFDHPPVIALIIKIGYFFFSNEFGVRVISALMLSASLWIVFKLSEVEDSWLYTFLIFSSFPLILFGFTAMPDTPMIFSIALFFLVYKKWLSNESWSLTLSLAAVMAFMLYSKYHGILIILFTLASNPGLLRSKKFWTASVIGAIFFVPHLYWQYENDFPSAQYHLVDRSAKAYSVNFTLEYIGAQLVYYGPFIGVFMYWAVAKFKASDKFEKALQYTVWGTLTFFFLSTFKGRVEVNWTVGMLVPLLVLSLQYYSRNLNARKWFVRFAWLSIAVLLFARIHLIYPLMDFKNDRTQDFHGHKEYAQKVRGEADRLPIAAHRYQTASSLWFYTGEPVPILNLNQRYSQFDLWKFDTTLVDKKVAYVNWISSSNKQLDEKTGIQIIEHYPSFKFLDLDIISEKGHPFVVISWNKPLKYYSFNIYDPMLLRIVLKDENGKSVGNQEIKIEVEKSVQKIPIEVSNEIRQNVESIELTLYTDTLGVIRAYPPFEFR